MNTSQEPVKKNEKSEHETFYNAPFECPRCGHYCRAEKQEQDDLTVAYMSGFYDGKKKREWVGLTKQDVEDALMFVESVKQLRYETDQPEWGENFAAYLEAKLKGKNNG